MLHVIKIGSQIQIDDFGLLFNDCLCYPVDRFMCRSFRSVSVRSCLEVRFEDRFQDEFECSLDHAITDGRDRENSDFSPSLGISFFRTRMGRYVLWISSSLICCRKLSAPLSSMTSNVTPSIPGAPSFFFVIS